jgi:hypothetical protein
MEADALNQCAMAENCADIACTENACPDEWGTCHSGDVACADLWTCILGCQDAQLCQYNCLTEGTFMDQVLVGALAQCAVDNNCQDEQCVTDNCTVEAMACGI